MNILSLPIESLLPLCRARYMIKIAIVVACCGLCSSVPAVNPPPDGGYPNQNTAEGDNALFSLTSGRDNTATGFQALLSNTTGTFNTANGSQALESNTTGGNNTATGWGALLYNRTGSNNTATGVDALEN